MTYRKYDEDVFARLLPDYEAWKRQAAQARETVCAQVRDGVKPDFNSEIWRKVKECLLKMFLGKCAYCELKITDGYWGDVEHYRPKRKVEDKDHPGYYWLAYDTRNLLPSCQRCNQGKGKMNQFPVEDDVLKTNPLDPREERPLLLNPYEDCPLQNDFIFPFEAEEPTGTVEGKSIKGIISVGVYGLNRDELLSSRKLHQIYALHKYRDIRRDEHLRKEFLDSIAHDDAPFTAARMGAIVAWTRLEREKAAEDEQRLWASLGK